jgi:hypothetical protein
MYRDNYDLTTIKEAGCISIHPKYLDSLYKLLVCCEVIKRERGNIQHYNFICTLEDNPNLIEEYEYILPSDISSIVSDCLFCNYTGSLSKDTLSYLYNWSISIYKSYLDSLFIL